MGVWGQAYLQQVAAAAAVGSDIRFLLTHPLKSEHPSSTDVRTPLMTFAQLTRDLNEKLQPVVNAYIADGHATAILLYNSLARIEAPLPTSCCLTLPTLPHQQQQSML
jgi:hypothetical protein